MLSTLPKLADKAFILGFFLPSLLFVLGWATLFIDVPWIKEALNITSDKDTFEKLVVFIIAVWTLAVLMLLLNYVQYQVLEGIRWPISKLAGLKISQRHALASLRKRRDKLQLRLATDKSLPPSEYQELQRVLRELAWKFPRNSALLLPTRFGNAIRAFEHYTNDVYGADSVTLWSHLASVTTKQFHDALNDARSQVDCLVNICFFSIIVAVTALVRLICNIGASVHITPFTIQFDNLFNTTNAYFVGIGIAAVFICVVSYRLSIERIHSWGRLVKAAFDCYLPVLAKKLGYQLPKTAKKRRQFWIEVSQRVTYHRVLKPEEWIPISEAIVPWPFPTEPPEPGSGVHEAESVSDDVETVNGDSNDG